MTYPIAYATPKRRQELRSMPYSEYLRTTEWQQVRWFALHRDAHACVVCGDRERIECHHRTYTHRGEERPEDVHALCSSCHERHHVAETAAREPASAEVAAAALEKLRAILAGPPSWREAEASHAMQVASLAAGWASDALAAMDGSASLEELTEAADLLNEWVHWQKRARELSDAR